MVEVALAQVAVAVAAVQALEPGKVGKRGKLGKELASALGKVMNRMNRAQVLHKVSEGKQGIVGPSGTRLCEKHHGFWSESQTYRSTGVGWMPSFQLVLVQVQDLVLELEPLALGKVGIADMEGKRWWS